MWAAFKAGRFAKNPADFWYHGEVGFFDNYIVSIQLIELNRSSKDVFLSCPTLAGFSHLFGPADLTCQEIGDLWHLWSLQ